MFLVMYIAYHDVQVMKIVSRSLNYRTCDLSLLGRRSISIKVSFLVLLITLNNKAKTQCYEDTLFVCFRVQQWIDVPVIKKR